MRVLCVNRDRFQLDDMMETVSKVVPGADVTPCRDPSEAAELVRKEGCDVLLTGIDMGAEQNEGLRVARRAQEVNPRINIIFVTVCSEWEYIREVLALRVSGYVVRPYRPAALAEEFANLRYPVATA